MNGLAILVATHPLAAFLALCVLLLILAAGAWTLVLRLRRPLWHWSARAWERLGASPAARHLGWLSPPSTRAVRFLALDLFAGFAMVLAALSVFLAVADETGLDEDLGRFDDRLAGELRVRAQPQTLRLFAALTRLGDVATVTVLCIVVAAVLLWRERRGLAACWIAAVAGNGLLNRALKALFERSRPLHEHGWLVEQGWSFPSGHASGATAAYGMLAYLLIRHTPPRWHLPLALSAIATILLVGYSRIVLQVHYFSDVLAGFASGGAWLIVCIAAAELLLARQDMAAARSR